MQRGSIIEDDSCGQTFGSVWLSSDGSLLARADPFKKIYYSYAGQVRFYEWDGSDWFRRSADINGQEDRGYTGNSVSLSADGSMVAWQHRVRNEARPNDCCWNAGQVKSMNGKTLGAAGRF